MYDRHAFCLRVVAVCASWGAALYVASTSLAGYSSSQLQEITTFSGVGPEMTSDLSAFFAKADVAFIGTLDHATVAFVDAEKTELATRMFFRPTTLIKGPIKTTSPGTFAVGTAGGSYVQTAAGPRPVRPIEEAERLSFGDVCFVAADRLRLPGSPFDGQYRLLGPETLGRIVGSQVRPVRSHSAWFDAVMVQGRGMIGTATAGSAVDDTSAFLAAMRHGAKSAEKSTHPRKQG